MGRKLPYFLIHIQNTMSNAYRYIFHRNSFSYKLSLQCVIYISLLSFTCLLRIFFAHSIVEYITCKISEMGFKSVTHTQTHTHTHTLIIFYIFLTGKTSSSAQRTGKVNCVGVVQLVFVTQISGVMHTIRHKKRRMN